MNPFLSSYGSSSSHTHGCNTCSTPTTRIGYETQAREYDNLSASSNVTVFLTLTRKLDNFEIRWKNKSVYIKSEVFMFLNVIVFSC